MQYALPPGDRVGLLRTLYLMLTQPPIDTLALALTTRERFGRFSFTRFGPVEFYQISDPDLMNDVLVKQADQFHKAKIFRQALAPFLGNGLLLSEGEFWKRQRKLSQPAFHYRRIETYAETMVAYTRQMLARWRGGQDIYIDREMMKLTLQIVARTLFDADVSGDADHVGALMNEILDASNARITAVFTPPEWIPTRQRMRVRRAIVKLDAILERIITERRQSAEDRGDLLSMLLAALDDDGTGMTDRQLRDELMTIFLAGHETTAMALAWTWYLLSQNPAAAAKLRAEVDSVLEGRPATMADLARLPYTEQVVKEALRLYPPAPGVSREPVQDVKVGDYIIPKGALILLSMYAMHHDPDLFPEPEVFRPERFAPENEAHLVRYSYQPFGGGPRICIGNTFALMEARLILATMIQQVDLALLPDQQIIPQQMVTVRPKHGIHMRIALREAVSAAAPVLA
jgi:cytochrome P450